MAENKSEITLARLAGKPLKISLETEVTTIRALKKAGHIELFEGEEVTRDGVVLNDDSKVFQGDIVFIEDNDENG